MNRRTMLYGLGVGLLAAPLDAEGQQTGKIDRIGFLGVIPAASGAPMPFGEAFVGVMKERGWVEGRDFVFEPRYSEGRTDRYPALARELVNLNVDVILVLGTPHAHAAREATTTIPIVTVTIADPVGSGLAASLGHPGGNVTGMSTMAVGIMAKSLEL